jgi:hypothetical protein
MKMGVFPIRLKVKGSMSIYENSYFGFGIEFPEGWRHRYWGNRKNSPIEYPDLYQLSDSDLPIVEDCHKELFFAFKRVIGSPSLMTCKAGMAAFYRKNGYDLAAERKPDKLELVRKHGETEVMGIKAYYLYLEFGLDKYTSFTRFTYWQHAPSIWLNFAIEGDTEESYAESESVFSSIRKL